MADRLQPIPTPLSQHWRRVRYQLVPVVVFAAAVLGTGALWQRRASMPNAVGEVEAARIPVRSQYPGYLSKLKEPVKLFQRVEEGTVVAQLEDKSVQAALDALTKDVEALQAEVEATRARLQQEQAERGYDRLLEARRLALDVERTELVILDLQTRTASEKARLERYNKLLAQAQQLEEAHAASFQTVVDLTLERDRSDAIIRGTADQIEQAKLNLQAARDRLKAHPNADPLKDSTFLDPISRQREAQDKRRQELELRLKAMELQAPASGTICAILREPGQTVQAGEDILLIAPDRQTRIIAYVREDQRIQPAVGMEVVVRSRSSQRRMGRAEILSIGPQFEEVPPHQRRDPARLEWGLPVMITMPPDVHLMPGELVEIVFKSS